MSKYSTEELVNVIENMKDRSRVQDEVMDAIISNLRAGDKLCKVAREASVALRKVNLGGWADVIDKAIADYEGKE